MPVLLNPLGRTAILRLNLGPAPVLDATGAAAWKALVAGVRPGVFDALDRRREATAPDLARELSLDPGGLASLLRALAATGYVRRSGER